MTARMNTSSTTQRLRSLDVFRGFTIAAMVLVNNPGDWAQIYAPLRHATWHGWTFTDWIFPFFLFIVGVSMALSLTRAVNAGGEKTTLLIQLWRRASVIVVIGLMLNLIPSFSFETLRYPGVLQRIGLCIMIAAPIVLWWRVRYQFAAALLFMAIYTALLLWLPVADVNGVVTTGLLEPGRDTGAALDRALMGGHLWAQAKTWDPEGLLSTLPAVASLLFGVLTGHWLLAHKSLAAKTAWMLATGVLALCIGVALDKFLMPINKSLWTTSYAVFMTGIALLCFAACYWAIDACGNAAMRRRAIWFAKPLEIYGVNALFIFAFSVLVAKALSYFKVHPANGAVLSVKGWLFNGLSQLPMLPINASLLFAVLFNVVMSAVAWVLWRNKIFIKI